MTAESRTLSGKRRRRGKAAQAGPAAGAPAEDGSAQTAQAAVVDREAQQASTKTPRFRPRVRFALSVLIIGHLSAVFLPPLAFQTQGPMGRSPSVETLLAPVRGYGQFLYLDRGYAFFAPDPGPSHLIQVAVRDSAGKTTEQMFPDLDRQWPRLLYHRHFMLTEFLHEIHQPPGPPEELAELDPAEAEYWAQARARFEQVHNSMIEHLEGQFPGKEVAIRRIEHVIPNFLEYEEDPIPLDDPRLYNVLLDQPRPVDAPPADQVSGVPAEEVPPSDAVGSP